MKKFIVSIIAILFSLTLTVVGNTATASAEGKKTITNDFISDWNYYSENFDDYVNSNWTYCCGTLDEYYEMSYFAPQKMWVGTEAYCEISNALPHPGTNEMIIVIWTAPCGGTLSFDFTARKKYHGVGDGSAAIVYNQDKELLFEAFMAVGDSEEKKYSTSYSIKEGDKVYFVLDYIGNNWEDSTVFDIQITLTDFVASTATKTNKGCAGSIVGSMMFIPCMVLFALKRKRLLDDVK